MKSKNRILVIPTTTLGFDGITSVILNYYKNIDRSQVQFDFIISCGAMEWVREQIKSLGGNIYDLPSRNRKPLLYMKRLKEVIYQNSYKVVHVHGNSGTMYVDIHAAKIANASIRIAHSHNSTCNHKIIHKLLKPLMNREITHAIACSKMAGDWIFNKPYKVLNNGIELPEFKFHKENREVFRNRLGLKDRFVIGHIGHFSFQKNHEYLVDIFYDIHKKYKNSVLLLLGDGKLRKQIETKVELLGLSNSVIFMGKTPEAPKLLQAMDVLLFPSHFEGLPVTLIEAQAAGLPCIVSDKVTLEVKLTNLVEFIALDKGSSIWANKVLEAKNRNERETQSHIAIEQLTKAGYSIKDNVSSLKDIYFDFDNDCKLFE